MFEETIVNCTESSYETIDINVLQLQSVRRTEGEVSQHAFKTCWGFDNGLFVGSPLFLPGLLRTNEIFGCSKTLIYIYVNPYPTNVENRVSS